MGPNDTIQETTHRGYRFGRFLLDLDRATLFKDGIIVKLRPQSFDVLASRFLTPLRSDSRWEAWLSDEQTVAYQATDTSPSIAKVISKN